MIDKNMLKLAEKENQELKEQNPKNQERNVINNARNR